MSIFVTIEQLSTILNENSLRLSRTRKGVSDTSTSSLKRSLLLSGDALRKRSADNELRVHSLIFQMRATVAPEKAGDVRDMLYQIADLTNDGLLPAGRLRLWNIGADQQGIACEGAGPKPRGKVPPEQLGAAINSFCQSIFDRWGELKTDPVPLAAWAEWELNGGSLHPFYDGCGRISRSFAAALLLRGGLLPPMYDTLTEYFDNGNRSIEAFTTYMRRGITRSMEWITSTEAKKA